jgi:hypothetical protein
MSAPVQVSRRPAQNDPRSLNSLQVQFLLFLGDPKQQDLQNPQNLNSNSYAADNGR